MEMFANLFQRFAGKCEKDGDYITNPFSLLMGKLKLEILGNSPGLFMLGYSDSYILTTLIIVANEDRLPLRYQHQVVATI